MPSERHALGFRCPRCNREYGSLRTKTVKTVKQTKRLFQKKIPIFKLEQNDYGERQKIPIKRSIHPYKYDNLFGDIVPNRKPIINPPEPKPGEGSDVFIEKLEKFLKGYFLNLKILPYVLKKHPELQVNIFVDGLKVFLEYIKPISDGRWDRSWLEWIEITEHQRDLGGASRRFPAIKDGKNKYLSPRHIKQKIKKVDEFLEQAEKISPHFHDYMLRLKEIVRNDDDLKEKYIQLAREYDENKIQIMEQDLSESNNTSSKIYSHTYYYIRHYEPNMYLKQKKSAYEKGLVKKSQVSGKMECGPFKEEELPAEAIEKQLLQKQGKQLLIYMKIVFILSFQPFNRLSIHSIIGTETKDTIESVLKDLINFGLIVELNYSDYNPEVIDGLNNGSALSDIKGNDNSNLYYLLNWSNPASKAMFADYQKQSTRNEILNTTNKVLECSRKENSVYNRVVENTENSNCYVDAAEHVLELARKYKENGKSPLAALIDLKNENIFYTKVNYVVIWEAMEKAGLLQDIHVDP